MKLSSFLLSLLFCACSGGTVATRETSRAPNFQPYSVCGTDPVDTTRNELRFEATPPGCPFGVGDNVAAVNLMTTARVEIAREVPPSEGAPLCGLGFDFSSMTMRLEYDDNFFLVYGDIVVAASDGGLVDHLPLEGNLRRWNWGSVANKRMSVGCQPLPECPPEGPTRPYCLGGCDISLIEEGHGRYVRFPQIDFPPAIMSELVAATTNAHSVRFIIVGDDDRHDCMHGEFSLGLVRKNRAAR